MITAKKARELTEQFEHDPFNKLSQVYKFLKTEAASGHSNTFIDGDLEDLVKFKKSLKRNGFRVAIEGLPSKNPDAPKYDKPFLSVEW